MITVTHIRTRSSANFHDNEYEISGVPMNIPNTNLIADSLNNVNSVYGNEAFTPKPNGSSYTISVRGLATNDKFSDVEAIRKYILSKLESCANRFEKRK